MDSPGTDNEESEPHAYIHVPPSITGDKFTRNIVCTKNIKKFHFNKYIENPNQFKDKTFKWKRPDGEKMKCFVLCAAGKCGLLYDNKVIFF